MDEIRPMESRGFWVLNQTHPELMLPASLMHGQPAGSALLRSQSLRHAACRHGARASSSMTGPLSSIITPRARGQWLRMKG